MLSHCFGRSIGAAHAPTSSSLGLGATRRSVGGVVSQIPFVSRERRYSAASRGIAGALVGLWFATAWPSLAPGQTLDLGGVNQSVISLSGGGIVTNSGKQAATLTNQGPSSTFSGVIQDGPGASCPPSALVKRAWPRIRRAGP